MIIHIQLIFLLSVFYSLLSGEEWKTVYLASFPRSGNHWVRYLTEEATHIATSSLYRDRDHPHLTNMFPWGAYCTDHGYEGQCRFPTIEDPILVKTHYPFLTRRKLEPDPKLTICLIRHPIDAFGSYHMYKGGKEGSKITKEKIIEYVQRWKSFYEYWEDQPTVLFIRYEDLFENPESNLKLILETAGFTFDQDDIERAVEKYAPHGKFLKHMTFFEEDDIALIRSELSELLNRYQYDL